MEEHQDHFDDFSESEKRLKFTDDKFEKYIIEMGNLRYATYCGMIVKGLKETVRALKSQKAKVVYLAKDCDAKDYTVLVTELCYLFKTKLVLVNDWTEIRDTVMNEEPSSDIIERANRRGKKWKVSPKCYCAAIINTGDINKYIFELNIKK